MKLIIDIPEEVYKTAQKTNILETDVEMLEKTIINGTPIPDNATVCDIEQLKTKIIGMSCRYSLARERGCAGQVEWSDRLIKYEDVLKVFEEYQKGGKE